MDWDIGAPNRKGTDMERGPDGYWRPSAAMVWQGRRFSTGLQDKQRLEAWMELKKSQPESVKGVGPAKQIGTMRLELYEVTSPGCLCTRKFSFLDKHKLQPGLNDLVDAHADRPPAYRLLENGNLVYLLTVEVPLRTFKDARQAVLYRQQVNDMRMTAFWNRVQLLVEGEPRFLEIKEE